MEHLVQKKELWYCDGQDTFPPLFYQLYSKLQQFASQKDLYGFFLQLRDIFEFLIRWYDLTGFALAAYIQDMDTVSALCDPEHAYSFGDWVQIPPSKLKRSPSIGSTSLGKLLEVLNRHYNKAKIVSWRNESIGHGAIQPGTSQDFLDTLEGKLSDLTQCLSTVAPMAKNIIYHDTPGTAYSCSIDNGPPFPLEPFIYRVKDDYRVLDSLHRGNNSGKVLSYQTGKRTSIDMSFLHELSSRYYGTVPITVEGSFNDTVFSGKLDAVLQHFHASNRYWKQTHYFAWLFDCLSKYSHGVFLLRSESGTGKSVFTDQLDGSGKQALFSQGFICRAYHFSRMSVRPSSEFPFALGDLFRRVSECEDELHGQLPALTYQLPPEQRGSAMTAFLQAFQALYKRTYGHSKMLLILDGIDHLAPEDTHLLNFIPNSDSLTGGLYILVTCSSTPQQGTFQQDFLDSFSYFRKSFGADEQIG